MTEMKKRRKVDRASFSLGALVAAVAIWAGDLIWGILT